MDEELPDIKIHTGGGYDIVPSGKIFGVQKLEVNIRKRELQSKRKIGSYN